MVTLKLIGLVLFLAYCATAQTQTTGRISGTVRDPLDAIVTGARVTVVNHATGETRAVITDDNGIFSVPLLQPGAFRVSIEAYGFNVFVIPFVSVSVAESTDLNAVLEIESIVVDAINVDRPGSAVNRNNATRAISLDGELIADLPSPTRNFTQLVSLAPGVTTFLTDNTIVGRNTQSFSVNGTRFSQNNIQINGVDASGASAYVFPLSIASPAPESIADLRIQTSLYDASFGRAAGGSVQAITKSGSNKFHGAVYGQFRDSALTANNPFLKAAGIGRPVLERNVFGMTLGGPIKKDKGFFFASYQMTRERNGASRLNSLSVNVLTDPRLTDDRSATALNNAFGVTVHPIALALLNARLPNGNFAIPTPQIGGRYNGSAISRFHEEQFNANFDFRLAPENWLSVRFFLSHAPTFLARAGAINVPGFGDEQKLDQQLLSVQDIHSFKSRVINEFRVGYNNVRADNIAEQPFQNSSFGIIRAGSATGLPAININQAAGGIQFGTAALQSSLASAPTASLFDTVSLVRGRHSIRFGGEVRHYRSDFTGNVLTRGLINFPTFPAFLTGAAQSSQIGIGIGERSFRTTDYNLFVQDDWRLTGKLTLNFGLRYELDLPPYESQGRFSTFDPSLYEARQCSSTTSCVPLGPPAGGFVQARNFVRDSDDLSDVPNVPRRILNSFDPNNFAPRIGFAVSPIKDDRFVLRGGYGLFYSRPSFQSAGGPSYSGPFYFTGVALNRNLSDPFINAGTESGFPRFVIGPLLSGVAFDRRNRTPYIEQFNIGVQAGLPLGTVLEVAYVGTRGHKLSRQITINQGRLAGAGTAQIINEVTGVSYTTNSTVDAQLRAPYQGVALGTGFLFEQTSGKSEYDSLQLSITRRLPRGLDLVAAYTFAKSIDNSSSIGGGSGTSGLLNTAQVNELNANVSDPFGERANRGVSDFDRTHRVTAAVTWRLPKLFSASRSIFARQVFSGWQMSSIVTAMSGLPIDIVDSMGGSLFVGTQSGGGRPNYAAGATSRTATHNVPVGYFFDPRAFVRAQLSGEQPVPSSGGRLFTGASCSMPQTVCTDFGNVGRNTLRGPAQFNVDLSVGKKIRIDDARKFELRVEAFNLLNNVNFANPISSINAGAEFGKIISTSSNQRILQLAVKFNF